MKYLLSIILILFSTTVSADGSAIFTWAKPVPAFTGNPDPAWIINEYRLRCTVDSIPVPDRIILGYDTETVSYDDMLEGMTACFPVSYSAGAGVESITGATVTKMVYQDTLPNPPQNFNF